MNGDFQGGQEKDSQSTRELRFPVFKKSSEPSEPSSPESRIAQKIKDNEDPSWKDAISEIWNSTLRGVGGFSYNLRKNSGLADEKDYASFLEAKKNEYPDLYESYQNNLKANSRFPAQSVIYSIDDQKKLFKVGEELETFRREGVREGAVEVAGFKVPQEKARKIKKTFLGGALTGLAESVPAMVLSAPTMGMSFFDMAYQGADEEIKRVEKEKGLELSQSDKETYKLAIAVPSMILERVGLSGVLKNTAISKRLASLAANRVIKRVVALGEGKVTAATFNKIAREEAKGLKGFVERVGTGFLSEAETGGLQQLAADAVEQSMNMIKGKEIFDPKTAAEIAYDAIYAAGQEGIGGGIISTVVGGTSKPQMTLEEKKQVIEFVETLPDLEDVKDYIVENAKGGNIERGAAKRSYDTIKNYKEALSKIPDGLSEDNKVEALDLVLEKQKLQKQAEGLDSSIRERLIDPQIKAVEEQLIKVISNDIKTEEQVPSTEQEREAAVEAQPDTEAGEAAVETGRAVQLDEETQGELDDVMRDADFTVSEQEAPTRTSKTDAYADEGVQRGIINLIKTKGGELGREFAGAIERIKSTLGEGYRVVVLDEARYRDVTNTTGRGAYDTKNKVLYLNAQQVRNLDKDNVRAVYHEAIHPILTKRFGEASADFVRFKQDLVNAINRSLSEQDAATLIARLEAFEKQYKKDKTTEQQAEEFMTELGAIMTSEDVELLKKSGLLNRVKELINNLLRKLGVDISLDTENEVVEFMNSLAKGVRGGVAVADIVGYDLGKEAKTLDELIDGEAGVAIGSTERTDFQESRKITIPKTDFTADIPQISLGEALEKYGVTEGDKRKRYAIITSDFTKVGYDSLNQPINGGIGFVAIKKNVDDGVGFASLEESTAKSLFTRLRNNYGDNKNVVVLVMLQSPSSTIGNHYGAKYMYRALRALKESVGEKAFRKAVSESIASDDVLKPMNKSGKTKEQVVDILAQVDVLSEEDFVNNLIFEEQLSFNFRREYGRRILHPTTITKTGKKSKRTNTVAKELGELGFDMDGFLDEYAQKEFMIQGMLDTDRSSHVVAGFQVNTANKEDAESAVEQVQSRGILHGLFDGKVPAVKGTNFYLDGLYEVKANFAKDFLEFAVPDKGTKERKRIDNYAKKKYGKVYTKLDSNDKIDVKDWATERGLTIELKPEESQRATDVARGIPAVSDRGVEIEPVMEEEAPLSESRREEANKALEKRLKGDSLLEAKDTLDELLDNNAEINSDGTVVVYHRSTEETARKIVSSNEMFGLEDGVFFSTLRNGQAEGYGDSVVKMSLPIEMIEIDDVFGDEAHVRIPTKKPNQKISIKKFNPVLEQEAPLVESRRFEVDINPIEYSEPSFEEGAGRVFTVDGGRLEIAKGKESGAFMIMSLNVEEGKRRQGRAEALLSEALEYTEGKLTGMASNDSAVRLNYKLGMRSYYDPNLSLEETMKQRAKNAGGYMLMALPSYIQTVPKKQKTEKKEPAPRFSVGSLKSLIEKTSKTIEFGERMRQQHESGEAPMDEQGLTELNKILLEEKSKLDGYVKELEEHPLVESRRGTTKLIRDISVLITPATVREATPLTKKIKALSEKYDKLVKQFSETREKETLDEIRKTEAQILNGAKQEITEEVSKIKGVSVSFDIDNRGLWDGSFEPSLNMMLSITSQADTEAASKLLFDFAEKYSQDAFILEADSNFEQDVMNGERMMPLTEFDEFGLMHYPQIVYTFSESLTDEQVGDLSVSLQDNGVDAFTINNDEVKISVIKFFPEDSQLNETEQYEERKKDFEAKSRAAKDSAFDVLGRNISYTPNVRIRKSSYQGARNEGTEEQTREYDRSDVFKPFKEAVKKEAPLQESRNLAPNGQPSNLNDEQYKIVRTPEFKRWFGDWENDPENASKVVDENGEPLVVYHGTEFTFDAFEEQESGRGISGGKDFYFTDSKENARTYGGRLIQVFLNQKNPMVEDAEGRSYMNVNGGNDNTGQMLVKDATKEYGFRAVDDPRGKVKNLSINDYVFLAKKRNDGLVIENVLDTADRDYLYFSDVKKRGGDTTYVIFKPNQAKLADGSNRTFDPEKEGLKESRREVMFVNRDERLPDYDGIFSTTKTQGQSTDVINDDVYGMRGYFFFEKGLQGDVVMMSPEDYLSEIRKAGKSEETQKRQVTEEQKNRIKDAIDKGDKINMPFLKYSEDGKYKQQEGQNRAAVAIERGEKLIPVAVIRDVSDAEIKSTAIRLKSEAINAVGDDVKDIKEYLSKNLNLFSSEFISKVDIQEAPLQESRNFDRKTEKAMEGVFYQPKIDERFNKASKRQMANKKLFDRQGIIRRALQDANDLITQAALSVRNGSSAAAKKMYERFNKNIFLNVAGEKLAGVNEIIMLRRIISIYDGFDRGIDTFQQEIKDLEAKKKRTKEETARLKAVKKQLADLEAKKANFKNPRKLNRESALARLDEIKQKLRDETGNDQQFFDMDNRASRFFDAMREILKRKLDEGLITQDEYLRLSKYEYSPRMFVDKVFDLQNGDFAKHEKRFMGYGLSEKEFKKLKEGSEEDLFMEGDFLLRMVVAASESRVFANRLFKQLGKKVGSYEWLSDNKKNGFSELTYKEDGESRSIYVRNDIAEEIENADSAIEAGLGKVGKYFGTNILRAMATGYNPLFPLSNIPMDFANVLMFTDTYDDKSLVRAMIELSKDFRKNIAGIGTITAAFRGTTKADPEVLKNLEEAFEAGIGMDFLTNQGRVKFKTIEGSKLQRIGQNFGDFMSSFGENSELAMRLSVYNKVKADSLKKRKDGDAQFKDMNDAEIRAYAAFKARATIDFSQGGSLAKSLDKMSPYFNASLQGLRVAANYIRTNPAKFGKKFGESALYAITMSFVMQHLFEMFGWDDDDKEAIPEYHRRNYFIIPLPESALGVKISDDDGNKKYIKIRKLPQLAPLLGLFELVGETTYRSLSGESEKNNKEFYTKGLVDFENTLKAATVFGDMVLEFDEEGKPSIDLKGTIQYSPPVAKAMGQYITNYDFFRERNISYEKLYNQASPEFEGKFDDNVEEFYKEFGELTGMSPKRTKNAVEVVTTSPSTNLMVGVGYGIANAIMTGDKSFKDVTRGMEKRAIGTANKKYIPKKPSAELNKLLQEYKDNQFVVRKELTKMVVEDNAPKKDVIQYVNGIEDRKLREYAIKKYKKLQRKNKFDDLILDRKSVYYNLDDYMSENPELAAEYLFNEFGSLTNQELREVASYISMIRGTRSFSYPPAFMRKYRELQK